MSEKKELTPMEKMVRESEIRKVELSKKYGDLLDDLESVKGANQSYAEGAMISIPGTTFANFVNFVSYNQKSITEISNSIATFAEQISQVVEIALTNNQSMTVAILEEHIKQVKVGATVDNSVIEAEEKATTKKRAKK